MSSATTHSHQPGAPVLLSAAGIEASLEFRSSMFMVLTQRDNRRCIFASSHALFWARSGFPPQWLRLPRVHHLADPLRPQHSIGEGPTTLEGFGEVRAAERNDMSEVPSGSSDDQKAEESVSG